MPSSAFNGGQAFPSNTTHGMTLRDYFAAQALPSAIEDERQAPSGTRGDLAARAATLAYRIANAMLLEREREV